MSPSLTVYGPYNEGQNSRYAPGWSPPGPSAVSCHVPHLLLDTGALKTTEEKAEVPSLDKEGWLRPLRKCREASLAGADGHERSECEPDRAKQGRVVGSSHRLSEVERTTPAAPPK